MEEGLKDSKPLMGGNLSSNGQSAHDKTDHTLSQLADEPAEIPPKTQGFFGIGGFIFNFSCFNILHMMMTTYNMAAVRTLEKRFSLRSTETGILWSSNDIIHVCLVTFIGYFARRAHKPKVLSVTMAFTAVSSFLMVCPYFMFPLSSEELLSFNTSEPQKPNTEHLLCISNGTGPSVGDAQCKTDSAGEQNSGPHSAWYVFLMAQMLAGVGGCGLGTLGMPYVDENSSKTKASFYIGQW